MDDSKLTSGISVGAINALMTEIIDYATKLRSNFNRIDDIIYDTKNYYDDKNASVMRNKYSLFKDDLDTIINNIMGYNTDLANLKNRYKSNISTISDQIKKDTTEIIDKQW